MQCYKFTEVTQEMCVEICHMISSLVNSVFKCFHFKETKMTFFPKYFLFQNQKVLIQIVVTHLTHKFTKMLILEVSSCSRLLFISFLSYKQDVTV